MSNETDFSYNTLTLLNNIADNDRKPKLTDNPKKKTILGRKWEKAKVQKLSRIVANWFTLQLQTSSMLRGNDRY